MDKVFQDATADDDINVYAKSIAESASSDPNIFHLAKEDIWSTSIAELSEAQISSKTVDRIWEISEEIRMKTAAK